MSSTAWPLNILLCGGCNTGRATVGTGPFRFAGFTPGDRVELARNDAWWGEKPDWERVTVRLVRANPARVAALLSGQVDMIDHVPTTDIARLRGTQGVQVVQVPSSYIVFLSADSNRDITPFVRDNQGRLLAEGDPKTILSDPALAAIYFGERAA